MCGVNLSPETKIGGQIMKKMPKQPKSQEPNEVAVNSENLTLLVAVEQLANLAEAGYNVIIDPKGKHRLGKSAFDIIEKEIISNLTINE